MLLTQLLTLTTVRSTAEQQNTQVSVAHIDTGTAKKSS